MENNNLFVNTGSLIRTSITEKHIKLHVAVFNKVNAKLDYKDIFIPVLDNIFVNKNITTESKEVTMTFNDALKDTDLVFNDIYEVLDHIVKQLNVDPKYAEKLKLRLETVTKKLTK